MWNITTKPNKAFHLAAIPLRFIKAGDFDVLSASIDKKKPALIEVMKETARLTIENGFQFCTHAIVNRAIREVQDIYEERFYSLLVILKSPSC